MPQLTTHVLDTTNGLPAPNVPITLLSYPTSSPNTTIPLAFALTNADGRVTNWYKPHYAHLFSSNSPTAAGAAPRNVTFRDEDVVDVKVENGRIYALRFDTRSYYERTRPYAAEGGEQKGMAAFFPWVEVVFEIDDEGGRRGHWHVPVLLGRYGFQTYRGS
ncbi:Transthyretin [Ascobolus immersus RN42]|uniref:5-hydroxyisourate hydrolase n=1 Tax=Ascobolus immersus RN42 TaxID=1160509 RepID=A0A3N4I2Y6_ASCIM|nr:Transthyretin [Ascobolus immersus RN42]